MPVVVINKILFQPANQEGVHTGAITENWGNISQSRECNGGTAICIKYKNLSIKYKNLSMLFIVQNNLCYYLFTTKLLLFC